MSFHYLPPSPQLIHKTYRPTPTKPHSLQTYIPTSIKKQTHTCTHTNTHTHKTHTLTNVPKTTQTHTYTPTHIHTNPPTHTPISPPIIAIHTPNTPHRTYTHQQTPHSTTHTSTDTLSHWREYINREQKAYLFIEELIPDVAIQAFVCLQLPLMHVMVNGRRQGACVAEVAGAGLGGGLPNAGGVEVGTCPRQALLHPLAVHFLLILRTRLTTIRRKGKQKLCQTKMKSHHQSNPQTNLRPTNHHVWGLSLDHLILVFPDCRGVYVVSVKSTEGSVGLDMSSIGFQHYDCYYVSQIKYPCYFSQIHFPSWSYSNFVLTFFLNLLFYFFFLLISLFLLPFLSYFSFSVFFFPSSSVSFLLSFFLLFSFIYSFSFQLTWFQISAHNTRHRCEQTLHALDFSGWNRQHTPHDHTDDSGDDDWTAGRKKVKWKKDPLSP